MPEGDTVWLAAKNLHAALAGQTLMRTDFRVPRLATTELTGRRVLEVVPRGKHLPTRIEGRLTLHTHVRMEGSWHLFRPSEPWRGGPVSDVRVVLVVPDRVAVGYRLLAMPEPAESCRASSGSAWPPRRASRAS